MTEVSLAGVRVAESGAEGTAAGMPMATGVEARDLPAALNAQARAYTGTPR